MWGGSVYLDAAEKTIFRRHNEIRERHDLKPFCAQPDLMKAARFHSDEEILKDYSDHRSYDGRKYYETASERIKRFGYTATGFDSYYSGENIACWSDPDTANDSVMKFWMNSSGHRANMLNRKFCQIGVGVTRGNYKGTDDYTLYTVNFGRRS
jgi:uncharacterized protein YkwD